MVAIANCTITLTILTAISNGQFLIVTAIILIIYDCINDRLK